MDALVIGPPRDLPGAVAGALRRQGRSVLQAIPADADGPERVDWLLDEAGRPPLVVVFDDQPYPITHELLHHTHADVVLVAEQPAAIAGTAPRSPAPWPIGRGLKVVTLGRAGRRWFSFGSRHRQTTLSAERAAAIVLRACRLPAPAAAA
jgi:hypothetical protein